MTTATRAAETTAPWTAPARVALPRPRALSVPPVLRARAARLGTPLRFVGAGLAGNGTHALVFLLLVRFAPVPVAAVNVVAVVLSTVATNELHRRFTFRGGASTAWFKGHGVGGAAALTGLVLSTTALTLWHHLAPGASGASGLAVVYAVTGTVGLVNFLVLRRVLRAPALPAPR
ncbi:GtrA family protein [Kineococcus terrestris]|uniref:GtrA family protein n=1 Tax=Kineococcus terrestris TaxID=2044856 RepID=UPI0034DB6747